MGEKNLLSIFFLLSISGSFMGFGVIMKRLMFVGISSTIANRRQEPFVILLPGVIIYYDMKTLKAKPK